MPAPARANQPAVKRVAITLAVLVAGVTVPVTSVVLATTAHPGQAGSRAHAITSNPVGHLPVTRLRASSQSARATLKSGTVMLSPAWQDALASAACTATRVMAPKGAAGLGTTLCRGYRLVFNQPLPGRLQPGEVLVSGVSAEFPDGLMAMVTGVQPGAAAQTVVTAKPTTPGHAAAFSGHGATFHLSASRIMSEIASGRIRPSYLDPHTRIVPASRVPAAAVAKLTSAVGRSAASAPTSCAPSLGALSGGLFFETQNAAVNIPGTGVSVYFSGWGYVAITGFNVSANTPGYLLAANTTFTYDFTGYVYLGGQGLGSTNGTPSFLTLSPDTTGVTVADFPLGEIEVIIPDGEAGGIPVNIVPDLKIRFAISGNFMVGATADFSSGNSTVTASAGLSNDMKLAASFTANPGTGCGGLNGPGFDPTQFGKLVGAKFGFEVEPMLDATLWDTFGIGLAPTPFVEAWISTVIPFNGDCPNLDITAYAGISLNVIADYGNNVYTFGSLALGAPILQWEWGPFTFCGPPPVASRAPVNPPTGPTGGGPTPTPSPSPSASPGVACGGQMGSAPSGSMMLAAQILGPGGQLTSPNGQYTLTVQASDGNVVLYGPGGALWTAPNAWGNPGDCLIMQADGNLVAYDANGNVLWASGTSGTGPSAYTALDDNGTLAVYGDTGTPLWAPGTAQSGGGLVCGGQPGPAPSGTVLVNGVNASMIQQAQILGPGGQLTSPNGQYTLTVQASDGNVVLYGPGGPVWQAPNTWGNPGDCLIMQANGDLAAYDGAGNLLWDTGTSATSVYAAVQDTGTLAVYDPDGNQLWVSGT